MSLRLHETEEFKQNLGRLSAALKDSVKGREHPAILSSYDLAKKTALEWEFIQNAIQGELVQHVFGIKGATGERGMAIIRVPIDYGERPL
jgi:hypothetical protein